MQQPANHSEFTEALAQVGKRVKSPGGLKFSEQFIDLLSLTNQDYVVEYAPGMGATSQIAISQNPRDYRALEQSPLIREYWKRCAHLNAEKLIDAAPWQTGIEEQYVTKVYGENFMLHLTEQQRNATLSETHRILKYGGLFGIHELALKRDDYDPALKNKIEKELAMKFRITSKLYGPDQWSDKFYQHGFKVTNLLRHPVISFKWQGVLRDEGLARSTKIMLKLRSNKQVKSRVKGLREVLNKYQDQVCALCLIGVKH